MSDQRVDVGNGCGGKIAILAPKVDDRFLLLRGGMGDVSIAGQ
jgi:hypothetical protein